MEPNNTQQQNTQLNQPVQTADKSMQPTVDTATPIAKDTGAGSKKRLYLVIIMILLILGMGAYLIFAKNQLNNAQKSALNSRTVNPVAKPTITPTVAPTRIEDINIASPEADLNQIDKDVQGL